MTQIFVRWTLISVKKNFHWSGSQKKLTLVNYSKKIDILLQNVNNAIICLKDEFFYSLYLFILCSYFFAKFYSKKQVQSLLLWEKICIRFSKTTRVRVKLIFLISGPPSSTPPQFNTSVAHRRATPFQPHKIPQFQTKKPSVLHNPLSSTPKTSQFNTPPQFHTKNPSVPEG